MTTPVAAAVAAEAATAVSNAVAFRRRWQVHVGDRILPTLLLVRAGKTMTIPQSPYTCCGTQIVAVCGSL